MAVRGSATPPATTAPSPASVATRIWCLCSPSTRLAGVLRDRFSTIPPVSRSWNERDLLYVKLILFIFFFRLCQCPVVQRVFLYLRWAPTLLRSCGWPHGGRSSMRPGLWTTPRSSSVTTQHQCVRSLTSAVTPPTVWWWHLAMKLVAATEHAQLTARTQVSYT